jgi:membrane protein YqaA with SNARE-associated domain
MASICTLSSVCGAFLGYALGKLFFETVGLTIINFYNLNSVLVTVGEKYTNNAFLTIFTGAFTPIPYKALTISAGIFNIPLITLFTASTLGRGLRFFTVAFALKLYGPKIQYTIERYFNILSIIFVILFIAGLLTFKYIDTIKPILHRTLQIMYICR